MKKFLSIAMMLAFSTSVHGGSSSGPVQNYHVMGVGKLFFVSGEVYGRPTCSNGAWAVDLVGPNAAIGKSIYAAILSAHALGKTVYVEGTGTCDVWGDRETVAYVYVY